MKKIILLFYIFLLSCGSNTHIINLATTIDLVTNTTATKYANSITSSDLKTHLYKFASDEFEGRETG